MNASQEEKEIFDRPSIASWRRIDLLRYAFQLKGIPIEIVVRLTESQRPKGYHFSLSHLAFTPKQGGPHRTSNTWDKERLAALSTAVYVITMHYDYAVEEGLEPNMNWLVVNNF